jgi:Type I phosphodiesterase / nucleotide pyrophosphatase
MQSTGAPGRTARAHANAARTLLLALDAVSHRVAAEAVSRGAFAGWAPPSALVAPFPSLTHVGFAALFKPFGVGPSWGYEVRYFDAAANQIVGGNPLTYRHEMEPWCGLIDAPRRSVTSKMADYVSSLRRAEAEVDEIFRQVLDSPRELMIAYVGATDGLAHLYEDDRLVQFLMRLDARVSDLVAWHEKQRGHGLRIVLFSDHGCGRDAVHYTGSFRPLLRAAGLRVVDHLAAAQDVVAPTFGIVNYSALFLKDISRAQAAAQVMAAHEAVDLAAFSPGPGLVEVLGRSGRARVRWHGPAGGGRYACEDLAGDPLGLSQARHRLAAAGRLDQDGYAHEDDWLAETAFERYPDPLRRLALAFTGGRVGSQASVLLSLGPGWSWGWRSAYVGGLVRGGRLKGTHGGLDRESTLGFLTMNDPGGQPLPAVRAEDALAPFADAVHAAR